MTSNTIIRTMIIEDNIESLEYLINIITKKFPKIQIIGIASSVKKSIELINKEKPELIFMDIELTDGSSFEIFDQLENQNFEVVFTTAYDNFIQKAINHFAFSYITKPYSEEKLVAIIKRYFNIKKRFNSTKKIKMLTRFIESENATFLLHVGNEYISICTSDIIKCEANGNYTNIYLANNKCYMASNILKYYENLLEEKGFFKAHRSILININYIQSIYKKETIILKNKDRIHVSHRNKPHLTKLIKLLS